MVRRLSVAAALCLLTVLGPAHALGLGEIRVTSGLNQRFSATIPVTSLAAEDAANLRVRIAENAEFARAGLERAGYLSSIKLNTITDNGPPRIELSSTEIAREPLLTLLIEVSTQGGPRILREYTVFLDPPAGDAGSSKAPMIRSQELPSPASSSSDSEFFQTPDEVRSVARQPPTDRPAAPRNTTPGEYGPVRAGESLLAVAKSVRPDGASTEQTALALYEANPSAFLGGRTDQLRRGATLKVPGQEKIVAVSKASALARLRELSAHSPAAPAATTDLTDTAASPVEPAMPAAPPPAGAAAAPVEPAAPAAAQTEGVAVTPNSETAAAATAPASSESAAPAAGESTAATDVDVDAPAPSSADASEDAADNATASAPAAPADAPVAETPSVPSGGSMLGKLLPVLIALVFALVGFVVYRRMRDTKAQREYDSAAAEAHLPAPRLGATGTIAKSATSARDELEALDRKLAQQDDEDATRVTRPVADDDDDRTRATLNTTSRIPAYTGPVAAAAAVAVAQAESDVSSQMEANTTKIDLGSNDPIAEAEFHLAYGLYDEAALLLQQAAQKNPGRTELRLKLAETYFGAGKPQEFLQTATPLKAQLSADEWSKLAIMGRQLCPDAAIFSPGAQDEVPVDVALDDVPDAGKVDQGLEFKLDEMDLPTQIAPAEAGKSKDVIEFDLGEFDLGDHKTAAPVAKDIDLKDFDLGSTDTAALGDVEPILIEDPISDEALAAGDDAGTKLDLARAYVEMGDMEMAKSLLEEVAVQGSDEQKREAATLRSRLQG